jgi:hypothetical protein
MMAFLAGVLVGVVAVVLWAAEPGIREGYRWR